MKLLKYWLNWMKLKLASEMAYRANFIFKSTAGVVFSFFSPLLTYIIYYVSSGVSGWSYGQFLILTGSFILVQAIFGFLFSDFSHYVAESVVAGKFDVELIKPIKPLSGLLAASADIEEILKIAASLGIIWYALHIEKIALSLFSIATYSWFIFLAILLFLAVHIFASALSIVAAKSHIIVNILNNLLRAAKNPLTIYGASGTFVLTFIFPLGVAAFYPATSLITPMPLQEIVLVSISPFLFLIASIIFWNYAIRKYTSAGG